MDPEQDPYAGMSQRKRRALELAREYGMPNRVETWLRLGTPVVVGRREGYRMWDVDGRELLDLHLNGGTFNLGHRNPDVQAALVEALAELDVGNHHFASEARGELAEKLARCTPGELHYSVLTPSGSEANDLAIRAARWATGRRRIVALDAGFHGATGLSGAAGRDASARLFHSDYPAEFTTVPFDDLPAMERALAPGDVAGVLLETIPATYGFPIPSPGYLPGVKALCERHGTILVADEVQTGLGRTGRMWAIDGFGVEPDVLVTGKGLSGGLYPISAVVMTREVGGFLRDHGWAYVSTFGGAEIGCRVASRVLDLCSHPDTLAHVQRTAARLESDLAGLRARHALLRDVRQQGLVIGLELDDPIGGVRLSRALYERGVWAMFAAFEMSVLQFKPGLLVDDAYCDALLERLDAALGDLEGERA